MSWTYLRFYRRTEIATAVTGDSSLTRGDASDTFSFASFWPDALHPFLNPVAEIMYNILVALHLCTPFSAEATETANEAALSRSEGGLPSIMNSRAGRSAPSGSRVEAERRRALALKALDQRLHAATTRGPGQTLPNQPTSVTPSPAPAREDLGGMKLEPDGETGGEQN